MRSIWAKMPAASSPRQPIPIRSAVAVIVAIATIAVATAAAPAAATAAVAAARGRRAAAAAAIAVAFRGARIGFFEVWKSRRRQRVETEHRCHQCRFVGFAAGAQRIGAALQPLEQLLQVLHYFHTEAGEALAARDDQSNAGYNGKNDQKADVVPSLHYSVDDSDDA